VKEERAALPEQFRAPGERRLGSDGAEYELRSRVLEADPLSQSVTMEIRGDMWRHGDLVASDDHVLRMNLYFKDELLLMLERAGFTDVIVRGDYTDEEPTADSGFLVFIARKVR
jgi:hypothetical protein